MTYQLTTMQSFHLQDVASVAWGEPHYQEATKTWVLDLELRGFPHGAVSLTFFGTEEQIRAIAAGHQAPEVEAIDPAQLDALEDAPPPPSDLGAAVFDLGVALNKIGTVATW